MLANWLTEPSSKRRTITEWLDTVALPDRRHAPSLDQCYRAIDALAEHKEATEAHLYSELCNLANLDLRLVCYDLTSSYFETVAVGRRAFPSLAFGYSRDHRSDRPQIMIGLLVTSDGIPIAHHVFSGQHGRCLDAAGRDGGPEGPASASVGSPLSPTGASSLRTTWPWSPPMASTTCWPHAFTTTTTSQPCSSRRTRPPLVGSGPRGPQLLCRSHP